MNPRDEEELTIQIPTDGSQTERTKGTYGGRQRWINNATNLMASSSENRTTSALASPRKTSSKARVTAPSVHSYLNSLGISVGEEAHIVEKEVNEVAMLRRDFDAVRSANIKKEQEIRRLEEEVANMEITLNARMHDNLQIKSKANTIENKSTLYESKLEEEMVDRGVYNHMIERLASEALSAKKNSAQKEKQLQALKSELATSMAMLLSARQEKSAAENVYKKTYQEFLEKRQENLRALDDMQQAVDQTRLKCEVLEQREVSRKQTVEDALGNMKKKESKRLRHESYAQLTHFSQIQEVLSDTDSKLLTLEEEFKKIVEAAGTNDVDKIIVKYLNREETLRALKEEHALADARMRKLRDKHKQLNELLSSLRGSAVNTRTIYQEVDQTSDRLKDVEKDAASLAEKFNRTNVLLDAFRACMLKCYSKLSMVHGTMDFDEHQDLHHGSEMPTSELLHMVEQKLNRVLDVINREKAERELHRTEAATLGGHTDMSDKATISRVPAPNETEEHFILRMSTANVTPSNIRVRPKSQAKTTKPGATNQLLGERSPRPRVTAGSGVSGAAAGGASGANNNDTSGSAMEDGDDQTATSGDHLDSEDTVIDRQMRKKLVSLVVTKGKRSKKNASQQGQNGDKPAQ